MATDDIFQNVGSTGNPGKELHQLVQLGRCEHWVLEDNVVEFSVDKNLGEGGFGSVYECRLHGVPLAVKMPGEGHDPCRQMHALGNEIRILRHLRHPNIVSFHGVFYSRGIRDQAGPRVDRRVRAF